MWHHIRIASTVGLLASCAQQLPYETAGCPDCSDTVRTIALTEGPTKALTALIHEQRAWIVEHAQIPLAYEPDELPVIKFATKKELQSRRTRRGTTHARFNIINGKHIVYLRSNWAFTPEDMGYLLHELVHDLQARNGLLVMGCHLNNEPLAYALEDQWLREQYPGRGYIALMPGYIIHESKC